MPGPQNALEFKPFPVVSTSSVPDRCIGPIVRCNSILYVWDNDSSSYFAATTRVVNTLPATGTPGVTYQLSQYPGSSLQWDAGQSKYVGALGSSFANLAAIQAVSTTALAYGVTASGVGGRSWVYQTTGWVPISALPYYTTPPSVLGGSSAAGILGDSLAAQNGAFPPIIAASLGYRVVSTRAAGGTTISQQTDSKISDLLSAGAAVIFLHVGTNDVTYGATTQQILADYRSLYTRLRMAGLFVYATQLSPRNAYYSPSTYRAMLAQYIASQQSGAILVDPWDATALAAGGMTYATLSSDGGTSDDVHPVTTANAAAAALAVTQIRGGQFARFPLPRVSGDTLVGNEHMQGTGTTPTGWTLDTSGASYTASIEAADSLGRQRWIATLTSPTGGDRVALTKDFAASGFNDGDELLLYAEIDVTAWPDTERGSVTPKIAIYHMYYGTPMNYFGAEDGGVQPISGRNIHFYRVKAKKLIDGLIPDNIRINVGVYKAGAVSAGAGPYTAKFGRVGFLNLTALGLSGCGL